MIFLAIASDQTVICSDELRQEVNKFKKLTLLEQVACP